MVGCLCFLTHGSSSGSERIVIYPLHNSVAEGTVVYVYVYEGPPCVHQMLLSPSPIWNLHE